MASTNQRATAAAQPCCLIAEDEALIALDLQSILEEAGITVAGPFASVSNALAWVANDTPTLAVLDVKLQDGFCTELAKALVARDVPIIIASGLEEGPYSPAELQGLKWLEKPTDSADLLAEMTRLAPSLFDSNQNRARFGRISDRAEEQHGRSFSSVVNDV